MTKHTLTIEETPRSEDVQRLLDHALAGRSANVAEQFIGPGDAMRSEKDIVKFAESVGLDERLGRETIQCRAGHATLLERIV